MANPAPNVQPSPRLPKHTLIELIRTLSGVKVVWFTDPKPYLGMTPGQSRAWIELKPIAIPTRTDELRMQYDETSDQNDLLLRGDRELTLQVKAVSTDKNLEAYDLCERVRFRLRTQTAVSIYQPANLAFRDCPSIACTSEVLFVSPKTKIRVPSAVLDTRWNWMVSADPLDPGEGGYIQFVNGGAEPGTLLDINLVDAGSSSTPSASTFPPPPSIVPVRGPKTVTAVPNALYVCDVTLGSVVINVPVLPAGTTVGVIAALGGAAYATNSITLNATNPQLFSQPPNQGAPVSSYVIGGPSPTFGIGSQAQGTSITWVNGGLGNVLAID